MGSETMIDLFRRDFALDELPVVELSARAADVDIPIPPGCVATEHGLLIRVDPEDRRERAEAMYIRHVVEYQRRLERK